MSKLNKPRGFLSWIVFALFPNSEVAWAALAGLTIALVLFVQDRRRGIPLEAMALAVATLFFFGVLGITAFADPHAPLGTWSSTLSFGWLAVTAWGGIALGQPFTLGMARQRVAREIWEQPAFKRAQTGLTGLWAVIFTITAALLAVCVPTHQGAMVTLTIRFGMLTIGAVLTSRHIKASRQGRVAAMSPSRAA